jgi:hypothetical protein
MVYSLVIYLFDRVVGLIFSNPQTLVVQEGPFKDMAYVAGAVGSSFTPKILGTYELEISHLLSGLGPFQQGLDIGAAEGYYAVGLLYKNLCDRMIAWEMDPKGRALLAEMAATNRLQDRLEIRGQCDPEQLNQVIRTSKGNTLVIIDCEGYEDVLIGSLEEGIAQSCTFLIETHHPMCEGVHERLKQKLQRTHEVQEFFPRRRTQADMPTRLPGLVKLLKLPVMSRLAMSERRCPDLGWLLCKPKTA